MIRAFARVVLSVCVALVFWGCSSPETPSIIKISELQFNDFSNIQFSLTLRNPNQKKIKLSTVQAEIWLDNAPIAELTLQQPIVLPKNSEIKVANSLAIKFRSEADELLLMFAVASWKSHKWEVSLKARGRYGWMPFHKSFSRVAFDDLQRQFNLPTLP